MKKVFFIASFALLVAGSLTSCCKQCSQAGYNTVQVCRDNYNSEQDYTNAVSIYEALGYTCN